MTEDEARKKWCPHAVASHTDPRGILGYQRDDLGLPSGAFTHACIASRCMAWRWQPAEIGGENKFQAIRRYRDETGATLAEAKQFVEHTPQYYQPPSPTEGYCGLAGAA